MYQRAVYDPLGCIQFSPEMVLQVRFTIGGHVRRVEVSAKSALEFLSKRDRINFGLGHGSTFSQEFGEFFTGQLGFLQRHSTTVFSPLETGPIGSSPGRQSTQRPSSQHASIWERSTRL